MDEYFTASYVSPGIYHIYENAGVCCTLITAAAISAFPKLLLSIRTNMLSTTPTSVTKKACWLF